MGKTCIVTGKKRAFGNNVSFSKKRTPRDFKPNVHKRSIYVPEIGQHVTVNISARGLRTIEKHGGLVPYLHSRGMKLDDVI